ncbi:unnamed protein product [Boreogadus saida]
MAISFQGVGACLLLPLPFLVCSWSCPSPWSILSRLFTGLLGAGVPTGQCTVALAPSTASLNGSRFVYRGSGAAGRLATLPPSASAPELAGGPGVMHASRSGGGVPPPPSDLALKRIRRFPSTRCAEHSFPARFVAPSGPAAPLAHLPAWFSMFTPRSGLPYALPCVRLRVSVDRASWVPVTPAGGPHWKLLTVDVRSGTERLRSRDGGALCV